MISEYAAYYYDSEFDICRFLSVTTRMLTSHTYMLLAKAFRRQDPPEQEQMPDGVCVVCAQQSLCCSAKQLRSHKLKELREITWQLDSRPHVWICLALMNLVNTCMCLSLIWAIICIFIMHMFLYKHNTPHTFTQRQLICSLRIHLYMNST